MSEKITVVLPVYNAAAYIAGAVASVLQQTFEDFILLIIDDGSTDESAAIIREFDDPRIRFFHKPSNEGLITTLNQLMSLAEGKYIARMDADDICMPERLATQYRFMESNENVGVCSSDFIVMTEEGMRKGYSVVTGSDLVHAGMLFHCPLAHPGVMIRSSLMQHLKYSEKFTAAEDYELWSRLMWVTKLDNIPERLFYYRLHNASESSRRQEVQRSSASMVRASLVGKLTNRSVDFADIHEKVCSGIELLSAEDLQKAGEWFIILSEENKAKKLFDQDALQHVLARQWRHACMRRDKTASFFDYFGTARRLGSPFMEYLKYLFRHFVSG